MSGKGKKRLMGMAGARSALADVTGDVNVDANAVEGEGAGGGRLGRRGGGEGDVEGGKGGKKERVFTMRFRHRNEEMAWERAQRSTLTNWTNFLLKRFEG
jgi:hypothetical protein